MRREANGSIATGAPYPTVDAQCADLVTFGLLDARGLPQAGGPVPGRRPVLAGSDVAQREAGWIEGALLSGGEAAAIIRERLS